jgi:Xaa-Pro aminopeptidase
MQTMIQKRILRLREAMLEFNLDTLLVLLEENRRYLSGFTGEDTQFDESSGLLLITDERLILATDSRFELQARGEATDYEIICYKKNMEKELGCLVRELGTRKMGFESNRMSVSKHNNLKKELASASFSVELVPADKLIQNLRIRKDKMEIQTIQKALQIAESAFQELMEKLTPGMTESEMAWQFEKIMRQHGAQALSFPTIVASGPNSALPHAVPSDRIVKTGEPLLFDFGAKFEGYCSDTTRTLVLETPDEMFTKIYSIVLDAHQMALEAIKPGMKGREIDSIARNHIDAKGFGNHFGHGLGHGVGLSVHEAPRLSPLSEDILEEDMIVTVEPGIYLPEWGGIRLENMVRVTNNGVDVLNDFPLNQDRNMIRK